MRDRQINLQNWVSRSLGDLCASGLDCGSWELHKAWREGKPPHPHAGGTRRGLGPWGNQGDKLPTKRRGTLCQCWQLWVLIGVKGQDLNRSSWGFVAPGHLGERAGACCCPSEGGLGKLWDLEKRTGMRMNIEH